MGCLTNDLARGLIINGSKAVDLAQFVPKGEWCLSAYSPQHGSLAADNLRFADMLSLWVTSAVGDSQWLINGENYSCWEIVLNTCMAIGSDPIRLCARLHSQCEIHAFVRGENRKWLAGIIRQGMASGVCRSPDEGQAANTTWESLADWLESNQDEPVVTSFSVTEQFPNYRFDTIGPTGEVDEEEPSAYWYELPGEERWKRAWDGLLLQEKEHLELKPDHWENYRFGHCKDVFWLHEQVALAKKK